uniref:Uncharacterized protein n=1 Tax=Timema cristinae TaxID=61476 RepID=A0A7R9CWZ8_TIMCR|nr:unnamed protein product [Timema cristinae]
MEGEIYVKIEPEDDLEYNLKHDEKFEIKNKKLCKKEGCDKKAQNLGKCWRHRGTHAPTLCKEDGCDKLVLKAIRLCEEEGCSKKAQKGVLNYINFNKMEGETSVKIEPEEDLEYNLKHDEKFEIKSEIDLPIKSEEGFKEEFKDYQQPECWTGPITLPPIKEELPKLQENLTLSIPIEQYCTSQAKINGCTKLALKSGKCINHGRILNKKLCKEEGCDKKSLMVGTFIRRGGTNTRTLCKEEECAKLAMKGETSRKFNIVKSSDTIWYLSDKLQWKDM